MALTCSCVSVGWVSASDAMTSHEALELSRRTVETAEMQQSESSSVKDSENIASIFYKYSVKLVQKAHRWHIDST